MGNFKNTSKALETQGSILRHTHPMVRVFRGRPFDILRGLNGNQKDPPYPCFGYPPLFGYPEFGTYFEGVPGETHRGTQQVVIFELVSF